ncbi:hypothetical protein AB0M43_12935 [Longispora sp. NPDC051575]|uniref:hypothetical protein n=1 Tax=Longispora sp. NPDC051575 TaxID=3154943 RepID=UPI00342EC13F
MSHSTIEAELAGWQREATALANLLRRHLGVDGLCPVCVHPTGDPLPDPCPTTTESRAALRTLCGEP